MCRRWKASIPNTEEVELRRASDDAPFSALAFKIMSDPFVGHVTYIRVYSGVLKSGSYVYNSGKATRERISRLLQMHANKREEIDTVYAGDICACVGLKSVNTGDTLCDEAKPIVLENIDFPAPVISVAIEPKTKADQDKLGVAMQRLAQEDPTFRVSTEPDTGQTLISGMGELHLEIIVDRMLREYNVQANVGRPQVAYRETIRKKATAEGKYIKQTGGKRSIRPLQDRVASDPELQPRKHEGNVHRRSGRAGQRSCGRRRRASGNSTRNIASCSSTRSLADRFRANSSRRLKRAFAKLWTTEFWRASPMVDVAVVLIDGSYHDVDSNEMAFKIAGSMAFKEACHKAIAGSAGTDHARRSSGSRRIHGRGFRRLERAAFRDSRYGKSRRSSNVIRAEVPLAQMFGYATDLRSRTQGRANFTMHFSHYAEAPNSIAEEIIEKNKGRDTRVRKDLVQEIL